MTYKTKKNTVPVTDSKVSTQEDKKATDAIQSNDVIEAMDAAESNNSVDTDKATDTIEKATDKPIANDILDGFTLLIADGKALKLSPKTQNHVFYQLAVKDEDNSLHLRMSGNEGGGLHTKLWVSVEAILNLLDEQDGKSIKSTLLKPVFTGGSANNCGFMAAVLRSADIGLLSQSDNSVFVHRLHDDYLANKAKLLALVK